MKILVATTNPGKMRELESMLDADVEWVSLRDFDNIHEVPETGSTFDENAQLKAIGYAMQTGLWTIADDSGLEVDALHGEPGIHSARFSGYHKDHMSSELIDVENTNKVLKLLEGVPREKRTARFRCCICLASPDRVLARTEGIINGIITSEPCGSNGFGYDPIFYVEDKKMTTAEMASDDKNKISHRGQAVAQLKPILFDLLKRK